MTDNPPVESQRTRAKRERTERILAATRELLREGEDGRLTIPRIADRAGVSPMTIFNLIGTRDDLWAALADDALADWQSRTSAIADPHLRARSIVIEVAQTILEEAQVFRALISSWGDSGRVIRREPTRAIMECLHQAAQQHLVEADLDARRLTSAIFSGLVGLVHQWAASLIDNEELLARAGDLVDIAFVAGRTDGVPRRWGLQSS